MLEQRIENLENQVAKLITAIERLTEVLVGDTPPPALASVKPIKEPTKEDAQKVLVELAKTKGKDIAKGVLAEFDAAKMGDVKPTDYQQVIDLAIKTMTEEAA